MIRIRLARVGKKKQPTYRLVVAGQRAPRDGRFLEILGHYNPLKQPSELDFNAERTKEWLAKGAQPSEAVAKLLAREGIGEAPRRASKPAKPVEEKTAAVAPAEATTAAPEAPAETEAEPAPAEAAAPEDEAPADETPAEEAAAADDAPGKESSDS